MNGLQLASAIREMSASPIRLVLLSSVGSHDHPDTAQSKIFDAALAKPVRRARLHRALLDLLRPKPALPSNAPGVKMAESLVALGRILVVEDNIVNQRLAKRLVEKLGYQADVAADGSEAVAAVELSSYDLILMDCQMPVMNGFEATRKIRAGSKHRTPILALTASALSEDLERCLEAGMDDCLTKPIRFERLDEAIKQWVSPKVSAQQPGALDALARH